MKISMKTLTEVKRTFKISKENSTTLKYVGIQIEQSNDNIILHQTEYKNELEEISIDPQRAKQADQPLTPEEQRHLKGSIGQLNWLSTQSCPEISFDVCSLATSQKNAKVMHLAKANKILKQVKMSSNVLKFPKLDPLNLELLCFTDASHNNLNDGGSQGGMITFLSDGKHSCPLAWYSKRIKRVARSALAAELMALGEGTDHASNLKNLLDELLLEKSPPNINVFTDNKSLYDSAKTTHLPQDKSIRSEIAAVREKLELNEIKLNWVCTQSQYADVLTKKGVNGNTIRNILKGGILPEHE